MEIGYPEWWPTKPKESSTSSTSAVHNVTASSTVSFTSADSGLSHEQYGHLLELLQPPMLAFSGLSPCPLRPITSLPWIIDSGATHHITTSNFISTLHHVAHPLSISVSTRNTINVTSTSDVKLFSSFTLHNVFFVPEFKFNLMSISQLTKSLNYVVSLYSKFCFF